MKPRNIAVSGAGVGGLAFAALAANAGHRITVFERFEKPQPVGSGLIIQPVGQHVLGEIGVLDRALLLGQIITRMTGRTVAKQRTVLDATYDPLRRQRFGLGIHRGALFDCLYQAAVDAGVTFKFDHTVTNLDNAQLEFERQKLAGPFDLVVDASGARSKLSGLKAKALHYSAIWGVVEWPRGSKIPINQLTQRYERASKMAGVLPIGKLPDHEQNLAAVFWSLRTDAHDQWRQTPVQTWTRQVAQFWPDAAPFFEQITDHEQVHLATYSHGHLRTSPASNLAIIGDAAHRTSPQLGQGANMALLDAFALIGAITNFPLQEAVGEYFRSRRRHIALYQFLSRLLTPQYQSDSRLLPLLRDFLLMPLSRIPPAPRLLGRLVSGDLVDPVRPIREGPDNSL